MGGAFTFLALFHKILYIQYESFWVDPAQNSVSKFLSQNTPTLNQEVKNKKVQ